VYLVEILLMLSSWTVEPHAMQSFCGILDGDAGSATLSMQEDNLSNLRQVINTSSVLTVRRINLYKCQLEITLKYVWNFGNF